MEYAQALKKVQAKKAVEHYLLIKLGYDSTLILPHKDGVTFMATLAMAEQFNDPYNARHSITELDRSKITVTQMSQEEYQRHKIAALLDISVEEAKAAQLQYS